MLTLLSEWDIHGIGSVSSAVAEKSVEVEAVGGPVGGKLSGVAFGVAGDRGEEDACAVNGTIGKEVDVIVRFGGAGVQVSVEG